MNIFQFMGEHTLLSIVIVWIIAYFITWIINRILRCINIAIRGYPTTQYMDADGDMVYPKNEEY